MTPTPAPNQTFRTILLALITVVCVVLVIHNPGKYFWTAPIALVTFSATVFGVLVGMGRSSSSGLSEEEIQEEMAAMRNQIKPSDSNRNEDRPA